MQANSTDLHSDIALLYVEDDAATRTQVSHILASRGYQLTIAEDGIQGLARFRELSPDIILTDIMMPGLNGLDMARIMKCEQPAIQIACMTAFSDTDYLIEAIDIGINQFVLKPVEIHRLFKALDRCQESVELSRQKKKLEEENLRSKKVEAIGILAGGMSHDFNNLLQVILGYVSLARMSAEPGSKTESLLKIVEQSSEKARELSARLMTFAKGGTVMMNVLSPEGLIKEGIESGLGNSSTITLSLDIPFSLPPVLIDDTQIKLVFTNLAANAREAMPNGGTLQVSATTTTLHMANDYGLPPGEYLRCTVADTGIGIPEDNMSRIFDPYFTTKVMGCQKGMGLGLALCSSIIRHHQGHIHAESEPGNGACFHILLPVYPVRE